MLELVGVRRQTRPVDPTSDRAAALERYASQPDDDDADEDEPLPIEGEA
jgi:hypothetical protein